jgi:hypothetical protein
MSRLSKLSSASAIASPSGNEEPSYTLGEFCEIERMSRSTYHKIKRAGRGPSETRVPGMTLIRITAAARREWHAKIEAWGHDQEAALEAQRRSEAASRAGKLAAASPLHVSKQKRAAARDA